MATDEYYDEAYEEEHFSDEEVPENEHEDQEGAVALNSVSGNATISSAQKNEAIRVLIKCFSSMVRSDISPTAIPDHKGRFQQKYMTFTKLLDASKFVVRAKRWVGA